MFPTYLRALRERGARHLHRVRPGFALVLALATAGVASRGSASVAAALSLEELTVRSEEVVLARCVAEGSRYDDRGRIVTDLTLEVDDAMKGSRRAGDAVVLTVLGGVIGDVGMQVPGEARMAVGDEAIVFVHRGRDGRRRAVGMSQGVLPVSRATGRPMVHPGGQGLHLVGGSGDARTARAAGALSSAAPLEDVVARIRELARSRSGTRP